MKKRTFKFSLLVAITVGFLITACSNEEWDRHFNNTDVDQIDQSLSDIIKNNPNLSIFYRMMEISGYDKVLASSQTFTVWAPVDSDTAWNDFEYLKTAPAILIDTQSIRELVGNHISRFSYPTSGLDSQRLFLLSNKITDFKLISNKLYFSKCPLEDIVNIPAKNGILHTISGYYPYVPSHWEYMTRLPGLDSLYNYFQSLISVDDYGDEYNAIFSEYAQLDSDDSTYTFLAPNNIAWKKALDNAMMYHKIYEDVKGLQWEYSKRAIIKNLFFTQVSDPTGLDSIISTKKTVFHDVDNLFAGAMKINASNGPLFVTDTLRMKATDSWYKKIMVQAEFNGYGRDFANADLYNRSSVGTGFEASDKRYIYLKCTSSSNLQKTSATFGLPNVLSAKYNLYVVFIPERAENAINPKPSRVSFYMMSRQVNGKLQPTVFSSLLTNVTISADTVQKVFVKEINLPWCSMYDSKNPSSIEVKVKVENVVGRSETSKMSRDLRIDCVILEPVEE